MERNLLLDTDSYKASHFLQYPPGTEGMYADPVIAERLEKASISAATSTPEELDAFIRKELDRWSAVLKDSGIQLN